LTLPPTPTVQARRVVLGAGTFGTTYLLLRNRSVFPLISAALGTRFSGNGDLLSVVADAHRRVGGRSLPRHLDPSVGPVITIPLLMAAMGGPQALIGGWVAALIVLCDGQVWTERGSAVPGSGGRSPFEDCGLLGPIHLNPR